MRNETHKKARWSGAIKKQRGERASEIGERGRREVKHYRGKKGELGKRSLKRQQMTSGSDGGARQHGRSTDGAAETGKKTSEDPGTEGEKTDDGWHTCVKQ